MPLNESFIRSSGEAEFSILDPENKYASAGLRRFEVYAFHVLQLLPEAMLERTRDVIQIEYGGDDGIVVFVTPDAIEVRLPSIEWTNGSHGPAVTSRLWRRVSLERLSDKGLARLLEQALEARHAEFQACRYCGRAFPPEHRHDDVCHGCAEAHLGIIH